MFPFSSTINSPESKSAVKLTSLFAFPVFLISVIRIIVNNIVCTKKNPFEENISTNDAIKNPRVITDIENNAQYHLELNFEKLKNLNKN
jgi:hypothetical protein